MTPETGYLYLINRYYDPATAQFLNRDPFTAITGQPHAYAGDDPVDNSDPTGLSKCGHPNGFFDTIGSLVDCASSVNVGGAVETVTDAGVHTAGTAISASPIGLGLNAASPVTGLTLGGCISGSFTFAINATGSVCYEQTPSGQNGITITAGGGKGLGYGGDVTLGPSISNAQTLNDLGGWFGYVGGSYGRGDVVSGSLQTGLNACNSNIWEGYLGTGEDNGLNIGSVGGVPLPGWPYSAGVGASYTWTYNSW